MPKENELVKVIKQSAVSEETVVSLQSAFAPFYEEASKMKEEAESLVVTDVTDVVGMRRAKTLRARFRDIRVEAENVRKELKAESLRTGKAIDGVANVLKFLIVPLEEHLKTQEKFLEVQEEKRKAELVQKRTSELSVYVDEEALSFYNLGEMSEEAFNNLLETSKKAFEAEQEAIKKAEADRIAEEKAEKKEQERIRKENEELKKKAEAREKEIEKERKELEEENRKEREAMEAKVKKESAEKAKIQKQLEAKKKAEEAERVKVEAVKKAEDDRKRQELLAPDKDKLIVLSGVLQKIEMPRVSSKEAGVVVDEVEKILYELSNYIADEAKKL